MDEEKGLGPTVNNDPPPSYDSVVGRVGAVRARSSGNVDFAKNITTWIFCGNVCSFFTLVILLAIPITNIVIGVIYKEDCPRRSMIPIYLIVAGSLGLVRAVINIVEIYHKQTSTQSDEEYRRPTAISCADGPISCFLFGWFIAGNVWVFGIVDSYQSIDPLLNSYCNEVLYLYSYWSIVAVYIIMAVSICVPCLFACVAFCCFPSAVNTPTTSQ